MLLTDISARGLVQRQVLHDRLSATPEGGVALICAAAGSGKTVLLRSWLEASALRVAWVSVERAEQDGQRFWLSVMDELAKAAGDDGCIRRTSPSPGFNGEAVLDQLVSDLTTLDDPVVLVVDDLDELHSDDALRLLERFLGRAPPMLRVVLATRQEPRLALHRVRLAGGLVELRTADLRFTRDEARKLLEAGGIALSDEALTLLCERTEGWVAGLRLAALSLVAHPEPERFVREFSGSERTIAGYLLAEVLERQPPEVRELLLRTSVLDRVTGPLADALAGGSGSEQILQRLADANAFVTAVDAGRSWFRYHHLFADLLQLELRRTAPHVIVPLHRAAAQWYEARGDVIPAIQHTRAAQDWSSAARLLAAHYFDLMMEGRVATVRALLGAIPADALDANAELPVLLAGTRVFDGLLDEADGYLAAARRSAGTVPEERRPFFDLLLASMSLWLASRRGDLDAAEQAAREFAAAFAGQPPAGVARAEEQRMVALLNLGIAELWGQRLDESRRDLEQALALARGSRRPYIEMVCLAWLAIDATLSDLPVSVARSLADDAVAIADEHGWRTDAAAAPGLIVAGATLVWVGRFEDAAQLLERAERAVPAGGDPHTELIIQHSWGLLRLGQGRLEDALRAFTAADGMQARLARPHPFTLDLRSRILRTRVQMGETAAVRAALEDMDEQTRRRAGMRITAAAIDLAEGRPHDAVDVLGPVIERSVQALYPRWATIEGLLFDATARERMGDRQAAEASLERALEVAEPEGIILPFTATPVRGLLERHAGHRTAHATLLSEIRDVLAGGSRRRTDGAASGHDLSDAELRVIRYLPSNLKAPEIASELFVSPNTVRTHLRHIYAKLDAHSRAEAIHRARELGLLAPSLRVR